MEQYIQVVEEENEEAIELPCEEDATLLLTTLVAQFSGACGLKYRNPKTGGFRGLRLVEGKLFPPEGSWDSKVFIVVYPKENKRKGEDVLENPTPKTKRLDTTKVTDLVVLNLPYKSTEEDLRSHFSQFGELLMAHVKNDIKTGQPKGFGFLRFADYESQAKCLSQRHTIDGRVCDVRIPNSRSDNFQTSMNRKIFVGRCSPDLTADDLRTYFTKFGEVADVFIPKPFRAFAFVSFAEPEVAQSLYGEDHIIENRSVHISSAVRKNNDKQDRSGFNREQGNEGGGFNGFGNRDNQNYNNGWGNQGGGNMVGGDQGGGQGNMGNMGFGNPFQLNPAMVAAAQAALTQPWGLLGMVNQAANNQAANMGGGGDNSMNKGGGNAGNYGNFGSGGGVGGCGGNQFGNTGNNFPNTGSSSASGGWNNSQQTSDNTTTNPGAGWSQPAKQSGSWS